jgi:hypothetical protein
MSELTLPCARRALAAVIVVLGIIVPAAAASAWLAGALLGPDVGAVGTPPSQAAGRDGHPS